MESWKQWSDWFREMSSSAEAWRKFAYRNVLYFQARKNTHKTALRQTIRRIQTQESRETEDFFELKFWFLFQNCIKNKWSKYAIVNFIIKDLAK